MFRENEMFLSQKKTNFSISKALKLILSWPVVRTRQDKINSLKSA